MFLSEEITKTLSLFSSYFSFELLGSVFFFLNIQVVCVFWGLQKKEKLKGVILFFVCCCSNGDMFEC